MAIKKVINSSTQQFEPVLTDKLVLDAVPTVNSFNSVTSDAVARAVAGASGEVPQVTESDNGKVLKAVYDAGGPAVEWGSEPTVDQTYDASSENAQSGTAVAQAISSIPSSSYTAGDGIDITSGEISVDYDTNTLDTVGQTIVENVTQKSSSGLFLLPSSVATLLSQQDNTQVTLHIPANMLRDPYSYIEHVGDATYKFTIYYRDSRTAYDFEVSLYSTPLEYTINGLYQAVFTEQDVVINLPASVANQWSQGLPSAVAFNICGGTTSNPDTTHSLEVFGDLSTAPITFTLVDTSATQLTVKNPLPASTSGDANKVLTVDSSGAVGWHNVPTPSVDEVPDVTSSDDGKVLTASYSGGSGSYSWQTAQGGGGGASVEAGAGLVKSGDTLSVNAYRGLRIGEPMSSFSIDSSNKFFTTPYFRNMASQVKCLCSTEASTSASWYGTTTAHIVIANADNAVYGVSTVEFEAGRHYESSTYLPRALYVPITFDASNFTMNAGHTFSDLGDNYATVNVFVTLKGTTGSSETPNGEQPLYVNKAYLSTLTSLNEIFYPTTEPPAGQRSFLTADYFNGMYSPFWNVAYPKPTSSDAGKVLQVQNDGTLAWVTLS